MDFLDHFCARAAARPHTGALRRLWRVSMGAALAWMLASLVLPPSLSWQLGVAHAQTAGKSGMALIPVARRDGVSPLTAARVEEYLRAMIEAGGMVNLVAAEDVETGRARRTARKSASPLVIEAQKNLDKADEALIAGRDGLLAGDDVETAYALLSAAIARYEKYFVELNDFTKLVDAYARAADAALRLGKQAEAKANITKALTIQPTLVLDRKAGDELRALVKDTREQLASRKPGSIQVAANIEGAKVFIDGVAIGDAPCEAKDLYPGTHYVQVRKEGAETYGKSVIVRAGAQKVSAKLEIDEDEGTEITIAVRFEDIKPIAEKGNYHEKVARNFSFMFTKQLRARYLLYSVLAKSMRGVELHMFLFDATVRKVAALDPVEFATNLSNMQMKILEAEGLVRAAIGSFPEAKEVIAEPSVYSRAPAASPAATPAPPVVTPRPTPDPEPTPDPTPDPEPTPDPKPDPEPDPEPRPAPVVDPPKPKPKPKPVVPTKDPYADLVKDGEDESIAKKWWFWTAIGVVAAGGATAAVLLLNQKPAANNNFRVDVLVQP